jgi:hypothetical protein
VLLLFTHTLDLDNEEDFEQQTQYTYALFFNFEVNQLYTFEVEPESELACVLQEGPGQATALRGAGDGELESLDGLHRLEALKYLTVEDDIVIEVGWFRKEEAIDIHRNQ